MDWGRVTLLFAGLPIGNGKKKSHLVGSVMVRLSTG